MTVPFWFAIVALTAAFVSGVLVTLIVGNERRVWGRHRRVGMVDLTPAPPADWDWPQ